MANNSNEACKTPVVFFKYVLIPRISQTLLVDKTFVDIIIMLRHPSILNFAWCFFTAGTMVCNLIV